MTDLPDDLIRLERTAEEERARLAGLDGDERKAQWDRWWAAAEALHAAVTEYANREGGGMSRYEVERAGKTTVRHEEQDPAE